MNDDVFAFLIEVAVGCAVETAVAAIEHCGRNSRNTPSPSTSTATSTSHTTSFPPLPLPQPARSHTLENEAYSTRSLRTPLAKNLPKLQKPTLVQTFSLRNDGEEAMLVRCACVTSDGTLLVGTNSELVSGDIRVVKMRVIGDTEKNEKPEKEIDFEKTTMFAKGHPFSIDPVAITMVYTENRDNPPEYVQDDDGAAFSAVKSTVPSAVFLDRNSQRIIQVGIDDFPVGIHRLEKYDLEKKKIPRDLSSDSSGSTLLVTELYGQQLEIVDTLTGELLRVFKDFKEPRFVVNSDDSEGHIAVLEYDEVGCLHQLDMYGLHRKRSSPLRYPTAAVYIGGHWLVLTQLSDDRNSLVILDKKHLSVKALVLGSHDGLNNPIALGTFQDYLVIIESSGDVKLYRWN